MCFSVVIIKLSVVCVCVCVCVVHRGLDAQIVKTVLGAAIALMLKEKLSAMQARMLRTLRGLEDGKKRHGALKGRAALT